MKLYPPPAKTRLGKQRLNREGRQAIRIKGSPDRRELGHIRRFAERFGLAMTAGSPRAEETLMTIESRRGASSERYSLRCSDEGMALRASGAGTAYGLSTAAQVLTQGDQWLPHFSIEDEPDFPHRGVMLDISRCKVPTLETLFGLIDQLAGLKYNQLQLYTEHTFAFTGHRRVWADASPLTAADIIQLRDYCDDRYIDLVPNLNSFGHFERWLRYPEYHRYAECPNGFTHPLSGQHMPFGSTLKPNKGSLRLLRELYDEYLPLFDSQAFNIGGDEPWELGQGWSRDLCSERGSTAVYLDFLREIQKLAEGRGRTMMFWSDIVLKDPSCLKTLSRDAIAMNWGYEGNHPFRKECGQMAAAKVPYYVCPGTSAWNSLTGRIDNASKNLESAARAGLGNGAIGYLVTDWGDHGHHQYLPISYPGFFLGGCHAWNHRASKKIDLADGIDHAFFDGRAGFGDFLVRLGQVLELAPSPIRNATIFNRLLFWQMEHEPSAVAKISEAELIRCDDEFASLSRSIVELDVSEQHGPVADELANAIRLARHGIHRLQLFRGTRGDGTRAREELAYAIGEHERLWLSRNRPGGLHESSGHLHSSLAALA